MRVLLSPVGHLPLLQLRLLLHLMLQLLVLLCEYMLLPWSRLLRIITMHVFSTGDERPALQQLLLLL